MCVIVMERAGNQHGPSVHRAALRACRGEIGPSAEHLLTACYGYHAEVSDRW